MLKRQFHKRTNRLTEHDPAAQGKIAREISNSDFKHGRMIDDQMLVAMHTLSFSTSVEKKIEYRNNMKNTSNDIAQALTQLPRYHRVLQS